MNISSRRMAVVLLLLSLCGFLQLLRGPNRNFPECIKLQNFPGELGEWTSIDESISQDVLDVLGPADILARDYRKPKRASD